MKLASTSRKPSGAGSTALAFTLLLAAALAPPAFAQFQTIGIRPSLLKQVGLDQKLNHQIPLDLHFHDERGRDVSLGQYFTNKPVILTLVYYQCPMLCTEVLNGLLESAQEISLRMGKDYRIVTVSIDPRDRPIDALSRHRMYDGQYGRDPSGQGWHFLTGSDPQIRALADAVGFRYAYDSQSGQYAHPSAIMVLTPSGKLSEYFYGITYRPRDLRLALVQASGGHIGNPVDAILLYCCSYDAIRGRYALVISRILRIAGALTVLGIALLIFYLRKHETCAIQGKSA